MTRGVGRRTAFLVTASVGIGVVGCGGVGDRWEPVQLFDPETFVSQVQPILVSRCGNPTCHARPERGFALYVPGARRLDPTSTFLRDAPLLPEEVSHNYKVSCVFAGLGERPEDALLLRKSLGEGAGTYHGGGAVFGGESDRAYRTILAWIAARSTGVHP